MNVLEYAKTAEINIKHIPHEVIRRRAIKAHDNRQIYYGNYNGRSINHSSKLYMNQMIITYIRHYLTNYDELIGNIRNFNASKSNTNNAIDILKKRTNEKINSTYFDKISNQIIEKVVSNE